MSKGDGGPAFPREDYQTNGGRGQQGMSLRDWFAGMVLMGMPMGSPASRAEWAYQVADAMLAERSKPAIPE